MFGTDLTWLGWIYVSLAFLGIVIYMGGIFLADTAEKVGRNLFLLIVQIAFIWGFFAVGFTH